MLNAPKANCAPSTAPDPEDLADEVGQALALAAPDLADHTVLGVAVSGGGDSLALLHILNQLRPGRIRAVTVDHGLRADSAAEAMHVAATCAELSVPHETLRWQGWSGRGNLQDAARSARHRLISAWARSHDINAVALGHTLDDQAETVLLRLARGSGVDGLSAMASAARIAGMLWLRPMLNIRRRALRVYLGDAGLDWVDDPSNENDDYDRVRARSALEELARIGLTREGLARTAAFQSRARAALEWMTECALQEVASASPAGYVQIDPIRLADHPEEVRLRVLSHALNWVSGAEYPPRFTSLLALYLSVVDQDTMRSLRGCLVFVRQGVLYICREPARCGLSVPAGQDWDIRWATAADDPDLSVAALGEKGLKHCPDWRQTGHPREALLASPGFWKDGELYAAPFALPRNGCNVRLKSSLEDLFVVSQRR